MKRLYLLSLATILVSGQDVLTRFKEEEVAGAPGGVLSEAPEKLLEVRYEEQEVAADLGNNLAVSKTQSQPRVTFADAKSRNKYTLGEPRHTLSQNSYNITIIIIFSYGGPRCSQPRQPHGSSVAPLACGQHSW